MMMLNRDKSSELLLNRYNYLNIKWVVTLLQRRIWSHWGLQINFPHHAVAKGTWNQSCHSPGLNCNTESSFDNLTLQKKGGQTVIEFRRPLSAITHLKNMSKDAMAKEKKAEVEILTFQYITSSC